MTLLLDALERTLAEPQLAHHWHRMSVLWAEKSEDEAVRRSILQRLTSLPESEPLADILRLTFLAGVTANQQFNYTAAVLVMAMASRDPDRLAAFMAFSWLDALQGLQHRDDFVAQLKTVLLPAMAGYLAQYVTDLLPPSFAARRPEGSRGSGGSERIKRVAVVVPYLGNRFHTPSAMAVEQAALLVREGCKVHMFSAQELAVPDMKYYRGDGGELTLQPLDMAYWTNILPAGVDIAVSDSRFSITRRWRDMLPVLANFNPDVVLLVGLYSPLAAALHTVYPVVGLSVNSVPPIAPMDVWLSADAPEKMQEASSVWSGAFPSPPPQPVFHPWRVTHTRASGRFTRAEFFSGVGLGQSNNAVIWVTVGFRLQYEVGGEWAARMLELLSRYSNVFWILVGGDASLPPSLRHAPTDRVRALPTRSDISDILRVCDIYVNPPRMGGGFSVVEAMAEGLPVTAFAGSDGGGKVGELALCEMDGYMQRLTTLTEMPALRVEMGQALRQRFVERFDLQSSGPALLAACHKACELAAPRLMTSAS